MENEQVENPCFNSNGTIAVRSCGINFYCKTSVSPELDPDNTSLFDSVKNKFK